MSRQPIIVKGMGAERVEGSLVLRVSDVDAVETLLVFGPPLAASLPQLIIGAPERSALGPTVGPEGVS